MWVERWNSNEPQTVLWWLKGRRNESQSREVQSVETQKNTEIRTIRQKTREDLSHLSVSHSAKRSKEIVKTAGIREAQTLLKKHGFLQGTIDGIYGRQTFSAVTAFQKQSGLTVDGIIGNNTLWKLRSYNSQASRSERWTTRQKSDSPNVFQTLFGGNRNQELAESVDISHVDIPKAKRFLAKLGTKERRELAKNLKVRNDDMSLIRGLTVFQKTYGEWLSPDGILWPATKRALIEADKLDYDTPRSQKDIRSSNRVIAESEKFRGIETLSGRWGLIFQEFYQELKPRERKEVMNGKPFSLVDARTNKLLFIAGKEKMYIDVILWQGGLTKWGYVPYDKKTPIGRVHKFNVVKFWSQAKSWVKKWQPILPEFLPADNATRRNLVFNKSKQAYEWEKSTKKGWERRRVTVTGFSIQSGLAAQYGWRYFHWVWPNRNKTWWCVWIEHRDYAEGMKMAEEFRRKWWFGYVSNVK